VTRAVNWYDVVVVAALLYGVWSGLRAGLMGEIIRVIGLVLMVVLAIKLYEPAGGWVKSHSQLSDETAYLLSFISIAVAVYLISVAARLATHRRMQQLRMGALVENVGGGFAGVVRMAIVMAWVAVVLSLSGGESLQRSVGVESRFGSFVIHQLPVLQSVVEKSLPSNDWFTQSAKRRAETNYESDGATNTNTSTNNNK